MDSHALSSLGGGTAPHISILFPLRISCMQVFLLHNARYAAHVFPALITMVSEQSIALVLRLVKDQSKDLPFEATNIGAVIESELSEPATRFG